VLAALTEPQREIVALHSRGCRRPEIAERLGVTPRSVKRALERIMALGRAELVRLAGHGCGSGERLVSRLAFGLASEHEIRAAQLHLATCPRCGALYERLDLWREKVAALLPIPAVAQAQPRLLERLVHAAADRVPGFDQGHRGGSGPLREQIFDAAGRLRQHATTSYARVTDPTPLAGVRPGAVAAAVAGCLAVGGGATYCVERGVDPIRGLSGAIGSAPREDARSRPAKARAHYAQTAAPSATPTPPPSTPTPTPAPTTVATPTPQRTAVAATPTPSPAPQDEYEPASLSSAGSSAQQSTARRREPAKAPASGPGEFDGP
jgi:hypothetical protein